MSTENDYAKGWRPQAGEELEGRVINIDTGQSDYGTYPILTIEGEGLLHFRTKDGEVGEPQASVHCVHSILRREIARKYEPTQIVGSSIRIKYHGLQQTKDGKTSFHNYTVFGGNRAAVYDWSQDLPEDERSSATASASGATSARATAEPPIAPAQMTTDGFGPLPPSNEPTTQQKAEQNYGSVAPF